MGVKKAPRGRLRKLNVFFQWCTLTNRTPKIGEIVKKMLFIVLAMAISYRSNAAGDMHMCSLKGSIYETAASARDSNQDPENALKMVASYQEVPLPERKQIINQVYFDPAFQHAGGTALRTQMMSLCVNGPKRYQPLQ
jgi:hypothetical protein